MTVLFTLDGQEISEETILHGLSSLSLQGRDLYVAMDLAAIGAISPAVEGREHLAVSLLGLFRETLTAPQSIIMPSFTFSWGAGGSGLFSRKDRTHLGMLPNYLIAQPENYRSRDPMFSCVVLGENQSEYISSYEDSFGTNSLFQIMHRKQNSLIMNFGTRLFNPSFIHYVEQYVDEHHTKLGYRARVRFDGLFEDEAGKRESGHFYSFMRTAEQIYGYNYEALEQEMSDEGLLEVVQIGGATVQLTDAESLFNHMVARMSVDPHYYLLS